MSALRGKTTGTIIQLGEWLAGRGPGALIVFKYMKTCCKNFSEQMFSLFTKDKTKQRMGLLLARGNLHEHLGNHHN